MKLYISLSFITSIKFYICSQFSAASSDSALSLPPPSSEESQSEPDTMSPVPEEVAIENMGNHEDTSKTYPLVSFYFIRNIS